MHRTFVTYKTEANAVMPSPEEAFDFMDNTLNLVAGKTILQAVKYQHEYLNRKNHCRLTQSE
jgi:hypothetical protein